MMWGYHDMSGWWMLFGGMGMFLFWGGLIWFAAFMLRSTFARTHGERLHHVDEAENILRRRFAAGELTADEFRRALETLHR